MPFDSLFVGVSGLEAYQTQLDVISNNIANVSTTGFKEQNVNFEDLLYQAQSYATAPTNSTGGIDGQQIGVGVKVGSVDTEFGQGGSQTTGVNTNLELNGDGFFMLRPPNASGAPTYTRNGDFSLNSNGLLYDPSSGMAVQGYMAGKTGAIAQTGTPGDITIPIGLSEQAVGTGLNASQKFGATGDSVFDVAMGGNLDQTQWIKEAQQLESGGAAGAGTPYTTSTTMYDSLGNAHLATITYTPDATGATPGAAATTGAAPVLAGGGPLLTAVNGAGATSLTGFTAKVNGTGTSATITDTAGNTVSGAAGSSVTLDGVTFTFGNFAPADAGVTQTASSTVLPQNGLPSSVPNATGTGTTPASRWTVNVSFSDGTTFNNPATNTPTSSGTIGYAYYDQNGQFINTSSSQGAPGTAIAANLTHAAGQAVSGAAGDQLNITAWGVGASDNATAPTAGGVPATGPIGLDFHNMTSLSGTASAAVTAQNGYQAGTLQNITIGADGTVTGSFSNGQTQTVARVAVATFQNEQGLTRVGGSDFDESANSGLAQIGTAGTGRLGSIVAGSLEESNVSIADEFTKMIAAQNAYQANSKSITTAYEDMQTVTNLIR